MRPFLSFKRQTHLLEWVFEKKFMSLKDPLLISGGLMGGHFNLALHFIAQNRKKHPLVFKKTKKDATVKKIYFVNWTNVSGILSVENRRI